MTPPATSAPFVYIASLRRTGSTMFAEALTQFPYSFIFREPALSRNKYNFKDDDVATFREHNIDLDKFANKYVWQIKIHRLLRSRRDVMVKALSQVLMPQLNQCVQQIGVKEIRHEGWRKYLRYFPDMKFVLTGRDPRDIYISLYYRLEKERGRRWKGEFSPETVAENLLLQFKHQVNMLNAADCMKVKYEDFCTDNQLLEKIKKFVKSPIPGGAGDIGGFLSANPKRQDESSVHGSAITDSRVRRWAQEQNQEIVTQAQKAFDLMPEYNKFWEYEK